jgi:hypothetical protein
MVVKLRNVCWALLVVHMGKQNNQILMGKFPVQ